jgi:hypothetical protein
VLTAQFPNRTPPSACFKKPNNLLIRKPFLHIRSPLEKSTLLDSKWHCLGGAHQIITMKNIGENILARAGGDYVAATVKALPGS